MKTSLLISLLVSFLSLSSYASNCSCSADPYTKAYSENGVINKWWGGSRAWSCVYSCKQSSSGVTTPIKGFHKESYVGQDDGSWGVCDGLVYVYEYNAYAQRFVWAYSHIGTFDPADSKSKELKDFARQHCR